MFHNEFTETKFWKESLQMIRCVCRFVRLINQIVNQFNVVRRYVCGVRCTMCAMRNANTWNMKKQRKENQMNEKFTLWGHKMSVFGVRCRRSINLKPNWSPLSSSCCIFINYYLLQQQLAIIITDDSDARTGNHSRNMKAWNYEITNFLQRWDLKYRKPQSQGFSNIRNRRKAGERERARDCQTSIFVISDHVWGNNQ